MKWIRPHGWIPGDASNLIKTPHISIVSKKKKSQALNKQSSPALLLTIILHQFIFSVRISPGSKIRQKFNLQR